MYVLNRDRLIAAWPDLMLPGRVRPAADLEVR